MIQQACIHVIQAQCTCNGTIHRAWCVVLALFLACLTTGCADDARVRSLKTQIADREVAINAEAREIEQQRSLLGALARKVEVIEAERDSRLQQLARVRKESPNISACILSQAELNGALEAIFGETEADRSAGGFVLAACALARLHDDYNTVSRQIDATLAGLVDVNQRLAEPAEQRRRAETALNQITAAQSTPRLQQEIASLNAALACERDVSCRAKRVIAGSGS